VAYLRKVTLVIALALVCIASTAHGRCIVDGSSGLRLVTRVVNGVTTCPPGFVCPGFNPSNVSTFPVYCPPTPDCTVKRLQGKLCSTPMGTFEPYLCPAGHYCPNATQVLLCPSGTSRWSLLPQCYASITLPIRDVLSIRPSSASPLWRDSAMSCARH
ncbi:ABC transporter, putative, partial [Bodo saltans]